MRLQRGFSLIEVMIALAVIALSMSAALTASSSSTRQLSYLQQRAFAYWVAKNEMNRLLTGGEGFYLTPGNLQGEASFASQDWRWQATVKMQDPQTWHMEMRVAERGSNELLAIEDSYGHLYQH